MKVYTRLDDGSHSFDGGFVPANYTYKIDAEVKAGKATVVAYIEPDPTNEQLISDLESSVTQRNIRNALLGDQFAIDKIQDVENQISLLR